MAMFGPRITLFKFFGVEIRLDASWIIIAALITWSLATGLFPGTYARAAEARLLVDGSGSRAGLV
jgi:hypothetical protein